MTVYVEAIFQLNCRFSIKSSALVILLFHQATCNRNSCITHSLFSSILSLNNVSFKFYSYADKYKATHVMLENSRLAKWEPITEADMRRFIALTVAIGLTKQQDLSDYWSTDEIVRIPFYSKVMSRKQFCNILSYFHLANNDNYIPRGQEGHDPLYKLGTAFKDITTSFQTLWNPGQEIAIDEGLVPFKGKVKFKVYNPAKPSKYGIKSYELCDGINAFCLQYAIYSGASGEAVSKFGKVYDIVMQLISPYLNEGRILFVDNYYSSPVLFNSLAKYDTYATGTVRLNRKGYY